MDLCEVELSHTTMLALLDPDNPPILPDPLPSELEETKEVDPFPSQMDEEDSTLDPHTGIVGPTFDADESQLNSTIGGN